MFLVFVCVRVRASGFDLGAYRASGSLGLQQFRPDQTLPAEHPCANHDNVHTRPPPMPAEHPCANHDNVQIRLHPCPQSIIEHPGAKHESVQIRLHPCPQSIHVPTMITSRSDPLPFPQSIHVLTMITSRSDSIHARRASRCQT